MILNLNDSRYADIPSCGVPMIDNIQHHFGDEQLLSSEYRRTIGNEFRKVCRNVARNNQLSQEEKNIWVRAAINTINESYVIADAEDDYGCKNLTAEFCAILESEFLQVPKPICVKEIAMEIGAMEIFEEMGLNDVYITLDAHGNIVYPVSDNVPDGQTRRMDYLCLCLLQKEMGDTWMFYQKKICFSCVVQDCPYDVYWQMLNTTGEDNEKYHFVTPESTAEGVAASEEKTPLDFPTITGTLSCAQRYFEALYPDYMDANLKWKKKARVITNYHAYWVARILHEKFPGISIQMVGDYLGINNLRHYSTIAGLHNTYKATILSIFRSKNLDAPDPE